jgi:hypothetical protein
MNKETIEWANVNGLETDTAIVRIVDDFVTRKKNSGEWQQAERLYPALQPETLTLSTLETWLQGERRGGEIIPLK